VSREMIPLVAGRKKDLPLVYGDTPSFLGTDVIDINSLPGGYDVIVGGVPWEGTITWGSFTGCELAPRTIRHAAARYGGYLPEYDIDVFDHLRMGDIGDVTVNPNDPEETMAKVFQVSDKIYKNNSIPVPGRGPFLSPRNRQGLGRKRGWEHRHHPLRFPHG